MIRASTALLVLAGCAPAVAPPPSPPEPRMAPREFADDARPLPRYHSRRLALSLPLPDGPSWHIDDHSRPELVATHNATHSRVVVAVFHTDGLVGRSQCEELARERHLAIADRMRQLEDEVTVTQETFDTRIRIGLDPTSSPEAPLVGHVLAFGGFLRKCFAFEFSTQVDDATSEPALSARLAFARARILGGLELDAFASPPREAPEGPAVGPSH